MIEENKNKNDLRTVLVGFSFIIIISGLFFLKAHSDTQKNKDAQIETPKETIQKEALDFPSISVSDLVKKIKNHERILLLDARDSNSFNTEHILDSKNFSINGLRESIDKFNNDTSYIFIDDIGLTPNEIQAMKLFRDNDLTNIAYLEGGLMQWKNEYEAVIGIGDPYSLSDRSKASPMSSEELKQELSSGNSVHLVDTRTNAEYQKEHLAGAVNIYLDDMEKRRHELPLGAKIILYDNSGVGAFQGAVRLFDAGILNVYILSDGLRDWKKKGFDLVTQK